MMGWSEVVVDIRISSWACLCVGWKNIASRYTTQHACRVDTHAYDQILPTRSAIAHRLTSLQRSISALRLFLCDRAVPNRSQNGQQDPCPALVSSKSQYLLENLSSNHSPPRAPTLRPILPFDSSIPAMLTSRCSMLDNESHELDLLFS
jgi:hypothetical protein